MSAPHVPLAARPAGTGPILAQMLTCSFLWATSFVLMKLIGADLSPLALTAMRGLMGAAVLVLWLALLRQMPMPRGREWRDWSVLGVLHGIVPNTLTVFALSEITAGLVTMIQASTPLLVAVFAHLLFVDERLGRRRASGVLVGFAGMALLIGPAAILGAPGSLAGALAMLGAAASYAAGNLFVRSLPDARPLRLALGQQLFSGLPALALVLAFSGTQAFAAVPSHALSLAALGLFATALPIALFMNILRQAGPTLGSMTGYLVPLWTIMLALVLLGETVGLRELAGGAAVLAGIAIVSGAGSVVARRFRSL